MSSTELVKWLLMFQGYSGLADKVSVANSGQRNSKGWLFDLGGIFLQGSNLYCQGRVEKATPEPGKKGQ